MSEKPVAGNAADAGPGAASASNGGTSGGSSSTAGPKKAAAAEGNPAFRMMGLPRLRLPSRNWMIFLSITGGFASAVYYDKYQTRRAREKWCHLVSHIADETLPTNTIPRRMTIYLAAPPGDGLRAAREHFHNYVKPVLVAAAMDWDVIEGRKEGDVRFKTAERMRKTRRKDGEGSPVEEEDGMPTVEGLREKSGTHEFVGVAGDIVVGRHTWKEYIRGLHEGWLGPMDAPAQPQNEIPTEYETSKHGLGQSSFGDAAVKSAANIVPHNAPPESSTFTISDSDSPAEQPGESLSEVPNEPAEAEEKEKEKEKDKEEEKPKPRHPPPYIQPLEYSQATLSPNTPEMIGPATGINFPHILGFRNTPIRIYRFLTRRHLADSVMRDVAAAVLAQHRPFKSIDMVDGSSTLSETIGGAEREQTRVLNHEERDWWKTTFQPRKEHEESVWIEPIVLDERIASRMSVFQLSAEDEDRAKRIGDGREKIIKKEASNEDY